MGAYVIGSLLGWAAVLGLFGVFDGDGPQDDENEPDPDAETLFGSDGDDILTADGLVTLKAGSGADQISASGDATVFGGQDDDTIAIGQDGDSGATALYGGTGNDALYNYLDGISGESTLDGGDGDDYLYDFHAGDEVFGGDGSDRLTGADGLTMSGGAGNDLFDLWADEMPADGDASVITDFVIGEDQIALFVPPGEWLETMQVTSELVDGSTVVSVAFDQTAPGFAHGYDNDALGIGAPEDFSFVLQGITDFDLSSIKLTESSGSDPALRPLEDYEVRLGTSDDDMIDNYSPEYSHDYLFAGDGADTVVGGLWTAVSGGAGDDVVIHHLVADPAIDLPVDQQIYPGHTQSYGGQGNDLIVFEDDFVQSFYGYDTHDIGGFEVGQDQLGLIVPQVAAGDVEVAFGTEDHTGFLTATVTTPEGMLTVVLQGIYEAPAPGAFLLFEDKAAVLAGISYGQV